jgi:hypothetical protein
VEISSEDDERMGKVDFGGIVHVGFALTRLDQAEAHRAPRCHEAARRAASAIAMRYVDEYRDGDAARGLTAMIRREVTVMETSEYEPIAARYRVPIVITGFEPIDMLEGLLMTVRQLEAGRSTVGRHREATPA